MSLNTMKTILLSKHIRNFNWLGWKIETAWYNETFGTNGLLGRENKSEIILSKFLLPVLEKLNPNLPKSAYKDAYNKIALKDVGKLDKINKEKYALFKSGVKVSLIMIWELQQKH